MKKVLSIVLTIALIVSLAPSMVFAASANSVETSKYAVGTKEKLPRVQIDIKNDDNTAWGSGQKVRITFSNASWTVKPNVGIVNSDVISKTDNDETSTLTITSNGDNPVSFQEVTAVGSNYITVVINGSLEAGKRWSLFFEDGSLKSGTADGDITVSIEGIDARVSDDTLTIARTNGGTTYAEVTGDVTTYGRTDINIADVLISETTIRSIQQDQVIKFALPKGVTWNDFRIGGDFLDSTYGQTAYESDGVTEYKSYVYRNVGSETAISQPGDYAYGNEERSIYVYVPVEDLARRQELTVTGNVNIGKKAAEGDITLTITSYQVINRNNAQPSNDAAINEASLVIAKYGAEAVSVYTAETIPTIYSGYIHPNTSDSKFFWIQLTIEESLQNSLASDRYIDVELPDSVQVVQAFDQNGNPIVNMKTSLDSDANLADVSNYKTLRGALLDIDNGFTKDRSEFTLRVPVDGESVTSDNSVTWSASDANTWSIFVPVTVEARYTGNIVASVRGAKAGLNDASITVATAESPITVEASSTQIRNGVQKQSVSDITITEKVAGYMDSNTTLVLEVDNPVGGMAFDWRQIEAEVISGDMEIGKVYANGDGLRIVIAEESTVPSTIKISNAYLTLDRTCQKANMVC